MKLLAPRAFADFSPSEFHDYVHSLYREPPKPPPPADFLVTLNAKNNPVIRIRRKPKWLTSAEVTQIADDIGWKLQTLWLHLIKKKIEIRTPKREKK